VRVRAYNGEPDAEIIGRLERLIEADPFEVHIARTFPLERATDAHRALGDITSGSSPCGRVDGAWPRVRSSAPHDDRHA
jgi:hypothetical protein